MLPVFFFHSASWIELYIFSLFWLINDKYFSNLDQIVWDINCKHFLYSFLSFVSPRMFFLVHRSTSLFYCNNLYLKLCVLITLCPQQLLLRGLFHIDNSIAAAVLCAVQVWSSLHAQWKSSGSQRESTTQEMPTGTSSPWCTQICRYSKEQLK